MQQLIKEERKEKEEGRRGVGLAGSPLGLVGGHRWVSLADPRFFFFLAVGLAASPRRRCPSPSL
jgi:hypothetical protein